MRSCSLETLKVQATLRWRPVRPWRLRPWSGRVSIVYGRPGDMFETLALEPTRDLAGPVTWRAFTREGVVRKLRRYCDRHGRVIEWDEVLC